jgi:dihydroorotate dehydrogenase (fumarate)
MANLKTSYLGLELENPLVVGSCSLTKTVDKVRKCAEAGAGAVVLKSLFEEQIRVEYAETTAALAEDLHPEALQYLEADIAAQHGPRWYLELIRETARAVSIPVIASVNCTGAQTWIDFAQQIAAAGAAALELNVYVLPADPDTPSADLERSYLDTVAQVNDAVELPLAVKLAPYFTNVGRLAGQLVERGADGLVLFNRLFHPDVDLEAEQLRGGVSLSHEGDHRPSLRWIALLSQQLDCDLCASGGVHDAKAALKQLLVGAQAVQTVSALYRGGVGTLRTMRDDLATWMDEKGYADVAALRGRVSAGGRADAQQLERAQYIQALVGIE